MNQNEIILENCFEGLKELSQTMKSRFSIQGSKDYFTIRIDPNNTFWNFTLVVVFVLLTFLMTNYSTNPFYWFFLIITLIIIILFFKFGPTTYDIHINNLEKILVLNSNLLIAKKIRRPIEIPFHAISDITYKEKTQYSAGMTIKYNIIYLHYNNKSIPIADLHNGPWYFQDEKLFVRFLRRLIKTGV